MGAYPSRLSQSPGLSSPSHTAIPPAIYFTYDSVYVSLLVFPVVLPSPLSHPPPLQPCVRKSVLYVWFSIAALQISTTQRQVLNRWTTKEVPVAVLLNLPPPSSLSPPLPSAPATLASMLLSNTAGLSFLPGISCYYHPSSARHLFISLKAMQMSYNKLPHKHGGFKQ